MAPETGRTKKLDTTLFRTELKKLADDCTHPAHDHSMDRLAVSDNLAVGPGSRVDQADLNSNYSGNLVVVGMWELWHTGCSLGHLFRTEQQVHANATGQLTNLHQRHSNYPAGRHSLAGHTLLKPVGHMIAAGIGDHYHILPVFLWFEPMNILGLVLALAPLVHSIV